MEKALKYVNDKYGKCEYDYINAHAPFYQDTEVELHWRAQAMTNLFANRRLQKWLEREDVKEMMLGSRAVLGTSGTSETLETSLVVPTAEFNAFYILLHCYHHMFESGLGLRQLMDYYFVLRTSYDNDTLRYDNDNILLLYKQFGMKRFATGIMWIMQHVFGIEDEYLLCEADEKEGRFLLNEVMQNGNFGHHDERVKKVGSGKMSELWRNVQHNWHLASHYPSEFLWQPVWLAYHYFWKRCQR